MDTASIALLISVAAVLVAGLSALYTRQQVTENRRANERADTERAERLEAQRLAAEESRVVWVIDRGSGRGSYALRNVGTETAYDVVVTRTSAILITSGPIDSDGALRRAEVPRYGSIPFSMADPSPHFHGGWELLVVWRGQEEPVAVPMPGAGGVDEGDVARVITRERERRSIHRSGGGHNF